MPNLFPGMNPFLEDSAFWSDFRSTFINCWRDTLRAVLPKSYEARIGERVYLVEPEHSARQVGPDVSISRPAAFGKTTFPSSVSAVTLEPVTIPLLIMEEPREAYIEYYNVPIGRLSRCSNCSRELPVSLSKPDAAWVAETMKRR
jgi:hypothetical protein